MGNKKIDYKQMFENLKGRTEIMLEMFEKDLRSATHKDDEVPDIYIGFKLGELHNQITTFRLEVMSFEDDIF